MRGLVGLAVLAGLCWLALAPVHGQAPGSGTPVMLGEVRLDFAPDGSGGRYPSTISAGESTKLRLAILNPAGEAVAAGSVVSILVTTSVGQLSATVGGGCSGGGSAGGLACQLPASAINASNADRLDVTLTHPGGSESGRASVQAAVLSAAGEASTSPMRTVTLAGASSTEVNEPTTETDTVTRVADGVGEVRFDFVQGSGRPAPTLSAGESTTLRLAILDQDGAAAAARSIASILVTTTAGRLSATVGGGCAGSQAC